jgi:hypothetical protein
MFHRQLPDNGLRMMPQRINPRNRGLNIFWRTQKGLSPPQKENIYMFPCSSAVIRIQPDPVSSQNQIRRSGSSFVPEPVPTLHTRTTCVWKKSVHFCKFFSKIVIKWIQWFGSRKSYVASRI